VIAASTYLGIEWCSSTDLPASKSPEPSLLFFIVVFEVLLAMRQQSGPKGINPTLAFVGLPDFPETKLLF